jgi:hypothetical protein
MAATSPTSPRCVNRSQSFKPPAPPDGESAKTRKCAPPGKAFLGTPCMHAAHPLSPPRHALLQADPSIPNDMRALLTDADGIAKARRCVCQSCRSHAARVFEHTAARQNVCVGDARLNGS